MKSAFLPVISFIIIVGFSAPETTFAYHGDSFFFSSGPSAKPREQLVVYAFGPSSPPSYSTNMIGSYQPGYSANGQKYPAQHSYSQPQFTSNQYPSFSNSGRFNSKFFTYTPVNVNNYASPQFSYSQPSYQQYSYPQYSYPQYSSYSYPSYNYGGYGYGSYGYGGYAQPTGNVDFFGNQLCNWGDGYAGYPCDSDPHQWIHDPYTDTWY